MSRRNVSWSPAEEAQLIEAVRSGLGPKAISARFPGRSVAAVECRISILRKAGRLPRAAQAENPGGRPRGGPRRPGGAGPRTCLACGREFASEGPMNRICGRCKTATARQSGGTAFDTPAVIRYR